MGYNGLRRYKLYRMFPQAVFVTYRSIRNIEKGHLNLVKMAFQGMIRSGNLKIQREIQLQRQIPSHIMDPMRRIGIGG